MAIVKVRLYATVRELAGTPGLEVEAANFSDLVRTLTETLGERFGRLLGPEEVDEGVVLLLNGMTVMPNSRSAIRFKSGDEVSIFPPVSGG